MGSINYLINAIVPPGNGEVHLVFSKHPTTLEMGALHVSMGHLVAPHIVSDGMNLVGLSLDWAHIISQLAIKAFSLY